MKNQNICKQQKNNNKNAGEAPPFVVFCTFGAFPWTPIKQNSFRLPNEEVCVNVA